MKFSAASGIAIAPILFVVALLAILATAIASATSSFSGGTDSEKARAMAEVVLSSCQQYKTALARMLANGCAIDKIDWRPDGPWPSGATYTSGDFTGGNGTNKAGNGKCAMHHILGGGMQWRQLPREALSDTGAYSTSLSGGELPNQDAFAGYPGLYGRMHCINKQGNCSTVDDYSSNAVIMLSYNYLRAEVCQQINKLLKFSWAETSLYLGVPYKMSHSFFANVSSNVSSMGSGDYVSASYMLQTVNSSDLEACGYSYYSNSHNSDYQYLCALMVR